MPFGRCIVPCMRSHLPSLAKTVSGLRSSALYYRRWRMAQAGEVPPGAAAVVDDYDAISRVLQLCTEGEAKGDVAKLKEAFHEEARMFGSIAGERFDVPIEELFKLAESEPADTGNYRSRVLSVQQTGDAAVCLVGEGGYWGTVFFI